MALFVALTGSAYAVTKVTSKQIKDNGVKSIDVKNQDLTATDVKDGSLGGGELADGAVGSAKIPDGAVGASEIADGAVGGADVADASLGAADLANPGSLGSPAIIAGTVDIPGVFVNDVHPMGFETSSDSRFAVAPTELEIRDLRVIAAPPSPGIITVIVASGDVTNTAPAITPTSVACTVTGSSAGLAECHSGGASATIPAGDAFSIRVQESASSVSGYLAYSFTARAD